MGVTKVIEGLDDPIVPAPARTAILNPTTPLEDIQDQKDRAAEEDAQTAADEAAAREADATAGAVRKVVVENQRTEVTVSGLRNEILPDASVVPNVDPLPMVREDVAQIELLAHNRMVIGDRLYERNVIYDMTEADARVLLRVRAEDGRPVFARYEMDDKLLNDRIVRRAPKPQMSETAAPVRVVSDAGAQSKIIEIGTEAELIAAGLIAQDAVDVIAANAAAARGESVDL